MTSLIATTPINTAKSFASSIKYNGSSVLKLADPQASFRSQGNHVMSVSQYPGGGTYKTDRAFFFDLVVSDNNPGAWILLASPLGQIEKFAANEATGLMGRRNLSLADVPVCLRNKSDGLENDILRFLKGTNLWPQKQNINWKAFKQSLFAWKNTVDLGSLASFSCRVNGNALFHGLFAYRFKFSQAKIPDIVFMYAKAGGLSHCLVFSVNSELKLSGKTPTNARARCLNGLRSIPATEVTGNIFLR